MFGATAVGGGDLMVVVLLEVESLVLLVVESVTIGCAIVYVESKPIVTIAAILLGKLLAVRLLYIYF
jgi:hypothetical protein